MGKFQNHDEQGILACSSSYGNKNLGSNQHVGARGAPNEITRVLRPSVVDFFAFVILLSSGEERERENVQ